MMTRRKFLFSALSVALVPQIPHLATAGTTVRIRPNWETFRKGPLYPVFARTIGQMRANKQSTDPTSWQYWTNVHQATCPHGLPYFLAWHRGFLRRFELQLRRISGRADLVLPYWDYSTDPRLPAEFTDDTSSLWRLRVGDNVRAALTLYPFDPTITLFARGRINAFEPALESAPHNGVHNLVGGAMANIAISPLDPLFWVHHANVDRLWVAWLNAGGGRHMPAPDNGYWYGQFQFGAAVAPMARSKTYSTTGLGYRYEDESAPLTLPSADPRAALASNASAVRIGTVPLGHPRGLSLDEHTVQVDLTLDATQRDRVRSLLLDPASATVEGDRAVRVVLDDVRLTALGEQGGYFYRVFARIPGDLTRSGRDEAHLLGTLGPTEIGAARMRMSMAAGSTAHAMEGMGAAGPLQMVLPAAAALRRLWPSRLDRIGIVFERADGRERPIRGAVISVGGFRMDIGPTMH